MSKRKDPIIRRMWINQPSTLQPLHVYHKMNCLMIDTRDGEGMVDIYFLEGDIESMRIPRVCLTPGRNPRHD